MAYAAVYSILTALKQLGDTGNFAATDIAFFQALAARVAVLFDAHNSLRCRKSLLATALLHKAQYFLLLGLPVFQLGDFISEFKAAAGLCCG